MQALSSAQPPKILTKEDLLGDLKIEISPLLFLTPQQHLTEKFLCIPSISSENMPEGLREQQLSWMVQRTIYTRQFLQGTIDPDDFLEALHETGVDVYEVLDYWENGYSFSETFYRM
jgi:hypothetical protein